MLTAVVEPRERYSVERLDDLRGRLSEAAQLLEDHPLSVYVTGSYGRLEAWSGSDIDLFFLHRGSPDDGPFPYTTFIRVAAAVITATSELGFPPFSGDGEYLEVHYVGEMEQLLGSREDDYRNAFTARMLLLLESRPLLNVEIFDELLDQIIAFYFRDFGDHAEDFLPVFLQNDILRFWRTLTLNYEHHRLKLLSLTGADLAAKKADSALKNFKLKVSRLATCFSMVAHLCSAPAPVTPGRIRELCSLTPAQRVDALRGRTLRADELLDDLTTQYDAFLALTQRPDEDLRAHFGDPPQRRVAFEQANRYGATIFNIVEEITPADRGRFLVI
jgi:Putative nucleotidyltransferase DUF294